MVCGYFMLLMVLWALVNNINGGSIFWQESGALEAFGVAWLAKSRVEHTVGRLKTAAVGFLTPGQRR